MLKKLLKIAVGILTISLCGLAVFWFSRDRDVSFDKLKAQVAHSEYSKFTEIDGLRVHYQEKGSGTPIVLIHGFSSSTHTWKDVFLPLSEHHRVISLDLKGFGFSEKPAGDYSRRAQADIVSKLLDRLKIRAAFLAGNSMGGEVALNVALKNPERVLGLILIDSAGARVEGGTSLAPWYLQTPLLGSTLTAISLTSDTIVREGLKKSFYDDSLVTDELVEAYYQPLRTRDGQAAVIEARNQSGLYPVESELRNIKAPTLLIWGAEDEVIPVAAGRKMKSLIKNSELVELERCGHLPQEEMPQDVISAIKEFAEALTIL